MICIIALFLFLSLLVFWFTHKRTVNTIFESLLHNILFRPNPPLHRAHHAIRKQKQKQTKIKKWFHKHIQLISWIYITILIISIVLLVQGVYNLAEYGSCTKPEQTCPFTFFNKVQEPSTCPSTKDLVQPIIPTSLSTGNPSYEVRIVEFGCYTCKQTKENFPEIVELLQLYEGIIYYEYIDVPPKHQPYAYDASIFSQCVRNMDESASWSIHSAMLYYQEELTEENLFSITNRLNLNEARIKSCLESEIGKHIVDQTLVTINQSEIQGIPTFFVNNKAYTGTFPKKTISKLVNK